MPNLKATRAAALFWLVCAMPAFAGSSPNLINGQVPTAAQWNSYFAAKEDELGYVPLNVAGGIMTGRLTTAPPGAATAGLNLTPGTTPASPANGDLWATSSGLFAQIGGATVELTGAGSASFTASNPLSVTFPSAGVVNYALNYNSSLTIDGSSKLGINLGNSNTWTAAQTIPGLTVIGSFTATGLVTNLDLANASVTVNGTACTLGSTCSPTASASSITVGTTTVSGGPGILYNATSGGALSALAAVNNSVVSFGSGGTLQASTTLPSGLSATNLSLTAPTIGVATGTSLALGGATLGANALAVTGSSALGGAVSVTSSSADALAVGPNGTTNPALQVDASTASAATGIDIKSAASGGGVAVSAISSGTNEALALNAKGSGGLTIGGTSTGGVDLAAGGTGVTVHNALTATGLVTYADMATGALATSAQYISGASSVLVPASVAYTAETTTTYGATTTFDFSTFINTAVTLTGNITTMSVANVKAGQAGQIRFIQDATGSRTTVWNSVFKFQGGVVPTLSTGANDVDALEYNCISSSYCVASLVLNVK